jgi:hypothetical protein
MAHNVKDVDLGMIAEQRPILGPVEKVAGRIREYVDAGFPTQILEVPAPVRRRDARAPDRRGPAARRAGTDPLGRQRRCCEPAVDWERRRTPDGRVRRRGRGRGLRGRRSSRPGSTPRGSRRSPAPSPPAAFDASGRSHGPLGVIYRIFEFSWADQAPDFAWYEAAVREGPDRAERPGPRASATSPTPRGSPRSTAATSSTTSAGSRPRSSPRGRARSRMCPASFAR